MKKLFLILGGVLAVCIVALVVAVMTFNLDAHRDQITQVLAKETGRSIKLGGPLKLSLSTDGVVLGIQDAAIGNPPWASRPELAGIGTFNLGIALLPLLSHELVITSLSIENADILLESKGPEHNWDMAVAAKGTPAQPVAATSASGEKVSIKVDKLSIRNSQVSLRSDKGPATIFKTDSLTLGAEAGGLGIHYKGEYNGQPLRLDIKTDAADVTATAMRPIDVAIAYAALTVTARGQASLGDKKAEFTDYTVAAGGSSLHGKLNAAWGGVRPAVNGTLLSDHLVPGDFKLPASKATTATGGDAPVARDNGRLFSDAPLALGGLQAADASFYVHIAELPLGAATLKQIEGTLTLTNGHLTVSPLQATLGNGALSGQINLDAGGSPAHLAVVFKGSGINIADMLELWGMQAFLTGKIDTDLNIAASGNSVHQLASTTSGVFNLVGAGGDVVSSAADRMSAALEALLSGGHGGDAVVNCMVARFTALNGAVHENGLLVDTGAATVAGTGGLDLRSETIDLNLRANPKGVTVGGLIPALHVGGSFAHPSYGVNAGEIAQNVVGLLLSGGKATGDSSVPRLTAAQGQNACLNTINHPTATVDTGTGAVQQLSGKASRQVDQFTKQMGGPAASRLLKGLFGQ